jgi:hypothetical protein
MRHGFMTAASPSYDQCVALMREFIGKQLR